MLKKIFCIKISHRHYRALERNRQNLFIQHTINVHPKRRFIIGRIVAGIFRLRYIAIAGTAGSGYYINKKYEQIKEAFPDLGQFKLYLPEPEKVDNLVFTMRSKLNEFSEIRKEMVESLFSNTESRYRDFENWIRDKSEKASSFIQPIQNTEPEEERIEEINNLKSQIDTLENDFEKRSEVVENSQIELQLIQDEHDREKARLEDEIKELRRQVLLTRQRRGVAGRLPHIKKSLIEMYSEVLDELDQYDSNYNAQDHLPRVVVVGEQSAGKTSVLEMVAQARLFPRGAGSMMTRVPVKVTLAEGPFRVARFEGEHDGPEYDLSTDSGQAALRTEIEARMDRMAGSDTVARQPISVSVRGPNLNRMVLIDLPGIINTETSELQPDTKAAVLGLATHYMRNRNAIILCVQDASRDPESSSIVDLVSSMDPMGKRTIFVLTKLDQAESQLSDPTRIKDMLAGKLFKMRALGYYAVVTGKGNAANENIDTIKRFEEQFFKHSKLFRDGVMTPSQMTTGNLSNAVSQLFWKMVRESVEHQADLFKALKFNLENEWKNKYSGTRELDRLELFERARGEILDNLIKLSTISPTRWEDSLSRRLWDKVKADIFEDIFIPAHESSDTTGHYKTTIENQLKPWAEKQLTRDTISIGWEVMRNSLIDISTEKTGRAASKDAGLFRHLKEEVQKRSFDRHQWDSKADSTLKIIQYEALNDVPIKSKTEWDEAVKFLAATLDNQLADIRQTKAGMRGPGFVESWTKWRSRSHTQKQRCAVFDEVTKIVENEPRHKMSLAPDEITAIKRNLQMKKIEVDTEFITESWAITFKEFLLDKARARASDCQKGFFHYHYGFADKADFDCRDVVFFRRLLRMLETSAAALRNQIMNNEMRRMEGIVKSVLDEIATEPAELKQLLTGDKVTLAENLKRVRQIQEKLDEFITALNKDK